MSDSAGTETIVLKSSDPTAIPTAMKILSHGGLVAFPTDTVYGVAARIDLPAAIDRLFTAKGRDFNKAIAVLIGKVEQLALVTEELTPAASRLADQYWPGALTIVVARKSSLPANLSPRPTVGVRMPDYAFACELLSATGPLATTSANLSGGANPVTAQDVLDQLNGRIDLLIDGGSTPGGVPSTVVDCTINPPAIVRHGAISDEAIFRVIAGL